MGSDKEYKLTATDIKFAEEDLEKYHQYLFHGKLSDGIFTASPYKPKWGFDDYPKAKPEIDPEFEELLE